MEETMNNRDFDRPVFVNNGQLMVEEIVCLADAFAFLEQWPKDLRGPVYNTAFRACQRAHDGHIPISVAREAFAGFANWAGILEESAMSWMAGPTPGRGGVAG
jgi:hypothetical protein